MFSDAAGMVEGRMTCSTGGSWQYPKLPSTSQWKACLQLLPTLHNFPHPFLLQAECFFIWTSRKVSARLLSASENSRPQKQINKNKRLLDNFSSALFAQAVYKAVHLPQALSQQTNRDGRCVTTINAGRQEKRSASLPIDCH